MTKIPSEYVLVAGWLAAAKRAVAFTGAGISTESGIPDFRSPGGIWAQSRPVLYNDFLALESARYEYWRQKCIADRDFAGAQPNAGHRLLAAWEAAGRLAGVVTQNIDELHQQAGSRGVLELHGTARRIACLDCGVRHDEAASRALMEQFLRDDSVPDCAACGGRLKHATVSFGQSLPPEVLAKAVQLARQADLFLAIGSSLVVEPAASLPRIAAERGARLVIINRDPTPLDFYAAATIREPIGEALTSINSALRDLE